MILNNKSTNVYGYTISAETEAQKAKVKENAAKNIFDPLYKPATRQIAVFTGVTGNHPRELLNSPAFKSDVENDAPGEGIEVIDENSKIDASRAAMNSADAVKVADFDVVEFCTRIIPNQPEKEMLALKRKQIHCIENIFKLKTLEEIARTEKRSDVILVIERQFKSIETSISKNLRSR